MAKQNIKWCIVFGAACLISSLSVHAKPQPPNIAWASHKIANLPESEIRFLRNRLRGWSNNNVVLVDAKSRSVAYPTGGSDDYESADLKNYEINGRPLNRSVYNEVGFPAFSHDGRTFFFWAKRSGKEYLVANGRESRAFDRVFMVDEDAIRARMISSDGRWFHYIACNLTVTPQCFFVMSSVTQDKIITLPLGYVPGDSNPNNARLSRTPFGEHFYTILRNPYQGRLKEFFMLDGKQEQSIHFVEGPYFDSKDAEIAYIGEWRNKQVLVVNGKITSDSYDALSCHGIWGLTLARDYSCYGKLDNQWFQLDHGKKGERVSDEQVELPPLKGKSSHKVERSKMHVIDGKSYGPYAEIDSFQESSDKQHWAFKAHTKDRSKSFYVVDGKEFPNYTGYLSAIGFSQDGEHWAYAAGNTPKKGKDEILLIIKDGVDIAKYPVPEGAQIVPYMSPDGKHVVMWTGLNKYEKCPESVAVQLEGQMCSYMVSVFIEVGNDNPNTDSGFALVGQELQFSPDGSKMGFLALKKNELWWIVREL